MFFLYAKFFMSALICFVVEFFISAFYSEECSFPDLTIPYSGLNKLWWFFLLAYGAKYQDWYLKFPDWGRSVYEVRFIIVESYRRHSRTLKRPDVVYGGNKYETASPQHDNRLHEGELPLFGVIVVNHPLSAPDCL